MSFSRATSALTRVSILERSPKLYNPVGSHRLTTLSPINQARINTRLRLPSYGSPYGLDGLSRRDRQRQSIGPNPSLLPMQRSPRGVGRPTFATCGHAGARRGRQQAERCIRMGISGRTCGDAGAESFYFPCGRSKPAATQGSPRATASASPRRKGIVRLFLSPSSFLFTHEKERGGAGGSQPQKERGVVPRIPSPHPINTKRTFIIGR